MEPGTLEPRPEPVDFSRLPRDRFYVLIWGILIVLTAATVGANYLDLKKFAVLAAVIIASCKATLVVLYFMHVRWEPRVIAIMVVVAVSTLAIFLLLTFTDLWVRYG
jgi:cytochrome c oxidase subunit 4